MTKKGNDIDHGFANVLQQHDAVVMNIPENVEQGFRSIRPEGTLNWSRAESAYRRMGLITQLGQSNVTRHVWWVHTSSRFPFTIWKDRKGRIRCVDYGSATTVWRDLGPFQGPSSYHRFYRWSLIEACWPPRELRVTRLHRCDDGVPGAVTEENYASCFVYQDLRSTDE